MAPREVQTDILIIGGGLTGLCLAYLLRKQNLKITIVEARNRLGGRILTQYDPQVAPLDLGPSWLGKKHELLVKLLQEIGLEIFEQKIGTQAIYEAISTSPPYLVTMPENPDPSFRIVDGSMALINKLAANLDKQNVLLNLQINSISLQAHELLAQGESLSIRAKRIVSTLPPNLLCNTIDFKPALNPQLISIAKSTHTWMGAAIKFALSFKEAFWSADHLSGTIFSNVGPVPELYDHSNYEDSKFALVGFLNDNYFSLTKEERKDLILNQLQKYFGALISNYTSYEEMIWRNEKYTYTPYKDHVLPHQNNGHVIYRNSLWENKLFVAGTETAAKNPGYMEGAIQSAMETALKITNLSFSS